MRYRFIWFILMAHCVSAQSIISGTITNAKQQSIPFINITLHKLDSPDILAFSFTNSEGVFTIKSALGADSIQLKIFGLGFASKSITIANRSQEINITLEEKHTELKEVIVKEAPINRSGDTLSYSVNAFKTQSDRAIGDLIKRLPGVEIDAAGRIFYQGKPINKYYIEGLDLLDGRYGLANENLPVDYVSNVQVIENHQPIKLLDSLVISDNAAINIQLRNKVAMAGTARLGLGGLPVLWDVNIIPMLFTKQHQFIATYQSNNLGNQIEEQIKVHTVEDVSNPFESDQTKKVWVRIVPVETPIFSTVRWLYNRPHLGSVNFLKKLPKDYELKLNVSYFNDHQRQKGFAQTVNYTLSDTINFTEDKNNHLIFNTAECNFILEKNNKDTYFKNQLILKKQWDIQTGVLTNNLTPVFQEVSSNYFSLTNILKDIFRIKKQIITFQSFLNYQNSPQLLKLVPSHFSELFNNNLIINSLWQQVLSRSFVIHNRVSIRKNIKGVHLESQLGFRLENNHLQSDIQQNSVANEILPINSDFKNQLKWKKIEYYTKVQIQYRVQNWKVTLNLPITYYEFSIKDTLLKKSQGIKQTRFEPRLNAGFEVTTYWKLSGQIERKYLFGNIDDIFYGYLLRDYRTIERRNVPLLQTAIWRSNLHASYQNPLRGIFGYLSFSKIWNDYNLIYASHLSDIGAIEGYALPIKNSGVSQNVLGQISKYFKSIKSQISLNYQKTILQRQQLLNEISLPFHTSIQSWTAKLDIKPIRKLNLYYEFKATKASIKIAGKGNPSVSQERHRFEINLFPNKKFYIAIKNDYYLNHLLHSSKNNLFSDISLRYTLLNKKIDFETNWTNIWNTEDITLVSASSFSYFESTYLLRPMQFIQKIRFSF